MIPRPGGLARPPASPPRLLARRPDAAQLPAIRRAELLLAGQDRKIGSRPVRVPQSAFVPVASKRLLPPPNRPLLALEAAKAGAGANDNTAAPAPARARSVLREVLFLLIFAATLAGTFYIGRMNAATNVIVVPGPSSYRSMVT